MRCSGRSCSAAGLGCSSWPVARNTALATAGAIGGSAVLGAIASGLPGKLKALVFDYAPAGKPSGATESKGHENDSRKKAKAATVGH